MGGGLSHRREVRKDSDSPEKHGCIVNLNNDSVLSDLTRCFNIPKCHVFLGKLDGSKHVCVPILSPLSHPCNNHRLAHPNTVCKGLVTPAPLVSYLRAEVQLHDIIVLQHRLVTSIGRPVRSNPVQTAPSGEGNACNAQE